MKDQNENRRTCPVCDTEFGTAEPFVNGMCRCCSGEDNIEEEEENAVVAWIHDPKGGAR